jgi:hypothetical protein
MAESDSPNPDRTKWGPSITIRNQGLELAQSVQTQKAPFLLNELKAAGRNLLGKRASFTVEAQRNLVDNGSISSGVTSIQSGGPALLSIVTTPQRLFSSTPSGLSTE